MTMFEALEKSILSNNIVKRVNSTEIATRCPFCGDSKKDKNKTRFYIHCDFDDNSPIIYYCFNCQEKGVFTLNTLKTLGINNLSLNTSIIDYQKNAKKVTKINNNIQSIDIDIPKKSTNKNKLNYLNNRLGLNEDYKYWRRMKSIFSINDLKDINKFIDIDNKMSYMLDKNYVSFLSSKNGHLICRKLVDDKYKHKKVKLGEIVQDNIMKYYSIPNSVDILTNDTITVNISEGIFDILGVYNHVNNRNEDNNIYIAVTGCGYRSVISYILSQGILGNVNLNIFSDLDKNIEFYTRSLSDVLIFFNKVDIYYNGNEKDFGVPLDKINPKKFNFK